MQRGQNISRRVSCEKAGRYDLPAAPEARMEEEDAYVQRERPDERADLVVDGGRDLWR